MLCVGHNKLELFEFNWYFPTFEISLSFVPCPSHPPFAPNLVSINQNIFEYQVDL